jgi:hypothetical protein
MLSLVSEIHSFGGLTDIPLYRCAYTFFSWWALGFSTLTDMNDAEMNIWMQVFVWLCAFSSWSLYLTVELVTTWYLCVTLWETTRIFLPSTLHGRFQLLSTRYINLASKFKHILMLFQILDFSVLLTTSTQVWWATESTETPLRSVRFGSHM